MIRHVALKELGDHWRDRRSVLGALVLPVLGPLLLLLVFNLIADRQGEQQLKVAIAGREHAADVVTLFEQYGVEVVDAPSDVEEAVRAAAERAATLTAERMSREQATRQPQNDRAKAEQEA